MAREYTTFTSLAPLKAADALQLAAALTVAEDDPASIGFVCFDTRLNRAAAREGFPILGP